MSKLLLKYMSNLLLTCMSKLFLKYMSSLLLKCVLTFLIASILLVNLSWIAYDHHLTRSDCTFYHELSKTVLEAHALGPWVLEALVLEAHGGP